jgi:hypothetical protein
MGDAIRSWIFGPFHQTMVAFALPAIVVGAVIGNSPWQLLAGMLGVVAYVLHRLRRAPSTRGGR